MPILIVKLTSFGIYDGLRLFLWCLPYFLIKNLKKKIFKIIFGTNILLFIIYFSIFIAVTPYQYTYLNIFSHFGLNSPEKFEGDYWNVSIKELVKKVDLEKFDKIDLITCGVHRDNLKENLYIYQKKNLNKVHFVDKSNAKYVLMTNRVVNDVGNNSNALKIDSCFNKYIGTDVVSVSRIGRKLSVIRLLEASAK